MNYNVKEIEFDFDDDYADTVCNSDLDTFFIASEAYLLPLKLSPCIAKNIEF